MTHQSGFEKEYSEKSFWNKLSKYAKAAGVEVVEKALLLFYAAQEETTPAWAKATIIGALGYFISLVDGIPDLTPIVGYTDDLGVLVMAIATISSHITEDVKTKAKKKIEEWFGDSAIDSQPDSTVPPSQIEDKREN